MDPRQRWTLILTSVASLMVGLDLTVVTTALNTIRLDLGASIAELDWTINAYTLTIGVLLLTAAAVGDRLGRRRVLVAGLAVFTASSAACALAPSIGGLIAARAAPGHRHRHGAAAGTGAAGGGVPAGNSRQGHGPVRRDHGPGHSRRPRHRRGGRPGPGLAVDLLAERPDRHCPDPARLEVHRRSPRPAHPVRRCWLGPVGRRSARPRVGAGPGHRGRLGIAAGLRPAGRRDGADRRVRGLGTPC